MTGTPKILVATPGAISKEAKMQLADAGIILIEIKNPHNVRFLSAEPDLPASELLACAGRAIGEWNSSCEAFGREVAKTLAAKTKDSDNG